MPVSRNPGANDLVRYEVVTISPVVRLVLTRDQVDALGLALGDRVRILVYPPRVPVAPAPVQ
jgi:hypothetical protein